MKRFSIIAVVLCVSAAIGSAPVVLVLQADVPLHQTSEKVKEETAKESEPPRVTDPKIDKAASTVRDLSTLITVTVTGLSAICAGLLVAWRKLREAWSEHEERTERSANKLAAQTVKAAETVAKTTRVQMAEVREVVQDTSPAVLAIVASHTDQLRQQIAMLQAGDADAENSRKKMIDAIWDLNKKVDFVSQTMMKILADAATKDK